MKNFNTMGIVGVIVQMLLYGMYVASSVISTYCMYHARGKSVTPNRVVMGISTALFAAITLFCALSISHVVTVVAVVGKNPSGSIKVFQNDRLVTVARFGAFFLANFCIDCLLVYRLYMIYLQRWRVIILPILTMLVYIGSSTSQVVLLTRVATLGPHTDSNTKIGVWAAVSVSTVA